MLPLELEPPLVLTFMQRFAEPNLCSQAALCSVVAMLHATNISVLRQERGEEFLCPITL